MTSLPSLQCWDQPVTHEALCMGTECGWRGYGRGSLGQQYELILNGGLAPQLLRVFCSFCYAPPHSLEGMFPITSSWEPAKQLFFQKGLGKLWCVNQVFGANSVSNFGFGLHWSGCVCAGVKDRCCMWPSSSWAYGLCWCTPASSSQPLIPIY